jgi:hypothetical protein
MSNLAKQPVHFYNNANVNIYNGSVPRNIDVYPRTDAGDVQLETDIMLGAFTVTLDNGAILSPGTIPPLVKPSPPAAVAFSQQIEGEAMVGNTSSFTFQGVTMVGGFSSAADYRTATLSIVGTNTCTCQYRYQTNASTSSHGSYSVNGGPLIEITLEGASGGQRFGSFTFTPVDGNNSIRFEGKDGTFFLDYIIVSRSAS